MMTGVPWGVPTAGDGIAPSGVHRHLRKSLAHRRSSPSIIRASTKQGHTSGHSVGFIGILVQDRSERAVVFLDELRKGAVGCPVAVQAPRPPCCLFELPDEVPDRLVHVTGHLVQRLPVDGDFRAGVLPASFPQGGPFDLSAEFTFGRTLHYDA